MLESDTRKVRSRVLAATFASIGTLGILGGAGPAVAQTGAELPTVRILDGELISPSAAAASYTSATATNGLCRDYPTVAAICTGQRAPEVRELARSLRNDPELIYEFVRNGVKTDFLFGAHKGPLGVIVDRSGTSFDQAMLLVELLREAGVTARYRYGVLTLTGEEFEAWTGVREARAVCKFLATAGIPGTVNGSASAACDYTGQATGVTLNHVWVEADYAGGSWFLDPSYKPYTRKAGIDAKAAMGLVSGQPMSAAAPTQAGTNWAENFNAENLAGALEGYADTMLARMRQADLQSADLDEVIGGREIISATRPAGGWRQAAPSRYQATETWTGGVPDVFRNTLRVNSAWGSNVPFDKTFFSDEIYGRRLQVEAKQTRLLGGGNGAPPYSYAPMLMLDDTQLAVSSLTSTGAGSLVLDVVLTANHPFAASGGAYADAAVAKKLDFILPAAIVHGWGPTSSALGASWDRERGLDRGALNGVVGGQPKGSDPLFTSAGDLMRLRVGATWLSQFSQATAIHSELAGSEAIQHHTLGVVSADTNSIEMGMDFGPAPLPNQQAGFALIDQTTVMDLETSFGLVSRTSDAVTRRAAVHAIAATAAALEGSVIEQLADTPDAVSSARRFAWGNRPESGETPYPTVRRFYRYPDAASAAFPATVFETLTATGTSAPSGTLAREIGDGFRTRLSNAIQEYANAGYDVVASSESFLGPGYRFGSRYEFMVGWDSQRSRPITQTVETIGLQNGAALIANRYGPSGEPVEIAHVLTRAYAQSKGGGGAPVVTGYQYDTSKSAEGLKDRYVDRSDVVGVDLDAGTTGFSSPVLASVGQGEFPYRLERKVEMRGAALSPRYALDYIENKLNPNIDHDGLVTNWDGSAAPGNSASEAMGQSRPDAAARTIAAFAAMQDIWRAAPSTSREVAGALAADWWGRSVLFNVVTVQHGSSSEQFVRLADETFAPTSNGPERLLLTGQRVPFRLSHPGMSDYEASRQARTWVYEAVNIARIGAHGDRREYEFWKVLNGSGGYGYDVGQRLKRWIMPNGVTLTLNYDAPSTLPPGEYGAGTPTSVSSNLGMVLDLPSIPWPWTATSEFVDAGGATTKVDYVYTPPTGGRPMPMMVGALYDPTDLVTPTLRYDYGLTGLVREARDGVAIRQPTERGPHQFFVVPGYRGERQDPEGGRYAVEMLDGGRLVRTIDELGRKSDAVLDGRKRVVSRTYPELDRDLFAYDVRGNMISLTRKAKPGAGLADLVSTTTWGEGALVWNCANQKTCNRLTSLDGPRTDVVDVTNFSWDGATGLLTQVLKPADNGGLRPQTDFGYTNLGVWLLTSLTEKIDASNSTTTTFEYDPAAQYRVKSGTVDSGGLNLRTCYQYNAIGDIVGVSDPRTTTCPATVQ